MLVLTTTPIIPPSVAHSPLLKTDKLAPNESLISPPLTPTRVQCPQFIPSPQSPHNHDRLAFSPILPAEPYFPALDHMEADADVAVDALTMLSQPVLSPPQHAHRRNKNNVRSFHRMRHRLSQSVNDHPSRHLLPLPAAVEPRIHPRKRTVPMRSPIAAPPSSDESDHRSLPVPEAFVFEMNIYEQYLRDPAPLLRPILPAEPLFTPRRPRRQSAEMSRSVSHESDVMSSIDAMDCVFENRNSKVPVDSDDEGSISQEDGWAPDRGVLDERPPRIVWKGVPLDIHDMPHFHLLHPAEVHIASTLRLTPIQYIKCKNTLVQAARAHIRRGLPFRKSDAQKLCRVDVNKTSRLWTVFGSLGWFGESWHQP
ncbi:hypothetical protein BC938DRAFT_476919 [Jimgerdemannia flammicorona]|uniref:SWIRM domain-containing protein n=1 Tax=Jimgerdemannia flammicorona TaxID=994334 RepID=A0A433PD96_9FUNG|nr:hypothetical protein BC938DRAFT_476919 [Jimgerdemannia flammicorona]